MSLDLSVEGMHLHNLNTLQSLASIAAVVGYEVEVELRPHWDLGTQGEFVMREKDEEWIAFTYEEALSFLVETINEKSQEGSHAS